MKASEPIKNIVSAIDQKLGAKTVNLASGVSILRDGYAGALGTDYAPITGTSKVRSVRRIAEIHDGANQTTGQNDTTLTAAVQRLCDGYRADEPIYSFGALSDLHIQYETGREDFERALTYLQDRVPFTCVCGDLVAYATQANMEEYAQYVKDHAGDMPIYECAGNHETYDYADGQVVGKTLTGDLLERWTTATGKSAYYEMEYGGDVFLFLSLLSENPESLFADGALAWLEQALETHREKRCFVFQHVQDPADDSADPSHCYSNILDGSYGAEFLRILREHGDHVIWFHGHTHLTLEEPIYPISEALGYKSVHIPSLAAPRFYDAESNLIVDYYYDANGNRIYGATKAEGYIVDVHENRIVIRGVDFAAGAAKDEVTAMEDEVYVLG